MAGNMTAHEEDDISRRTVRALEDQARALDRLAAALEQIASVSR